MAKNPPTSFGSYNAPTPTSSWSWSTKGQKGAGGSMPFEVSRFYETMFPSIQGQTGGVQKAMQQGISPTVGDYQQAIMRDLAQSEYLNRANFERREQARQQFADESQAAMNRFMDPKTGRFAGQDLFDLAASEQKRLEAETRANQKANEAAMARGRAALRQAEGQMFGGYNAALQTIGEGQDKIASDMAAAMRQTAEQQRAEGFGGLLGQLEGSESQVAEAQRLSQAELERGVGANVSQLQFQSAQQRAAIQQAKAQSALSLGQAKAGFETTAAQFGAQSRQATEAAIAGSAALAQSNAAFIGQQAQWLAANQMNRSSELYKMVESNPVLGVTWSDAFAQMGAVAQAGGLGAFGSPQPAPPQGGLLSYGSYNPQTGAFSQTPTQRALASRDNYGMRIQHVMGPGGVSGQMGSQPSINSFTGFHEVPLWSPSRMR